MSSKFAKDVIKELNKFRSNPKSIQHQCEVIRKGFSRIKSGDPFLNEIDYFVKELDSMKQLPQLELNEVLSEAAAKELPNFRGKSSYKKYRRADNIGNIVPDYYLVASPAMVADDGADEPINVLTKILLDKQDRLKDGRDILCDPKFTQVGIAHEIFDEENMVILIFATEYIEDEPDYDLPEGDLSELKQAFDILDTEGKEKLNMKEVMRSMDDLEFYKTNPTLYSILKDVSDKEKCSWPKFAYFANKRMTERNTKEGLSTIFNLFIDNPDKGTITFETFKRICNEIDCGLSDLQLKEILEKATNNGNEITFKEFQEYMLLPTQNK
jgi:Ca2+-binding EF-hand superfamily protein